METLRLLDTGAAFLLGFFGGMHCVGMCGGIVAAVSARGTWLPGVAAYHAARVGTYATLGLLIGFLGGAVSSMETIGAAQKTMSVITGLVIVFFALQMGGWIPDVATRIYGWAVPRKLLGRAANRESVAVWGMVGFFNGLLPCSLVYAALALSLNAASPAYGAIFMVAFGLGTVPALLAVTLLMHKITPSMRGGILKVASVLLVFYGIFVATRIFIMSTHHH